MDSSTNRNPPSFNTFFPNIDVEKLSIEEKLIVDAEMARNSPDVVNKIISGLGGVRKNKVLQIGVGLGYLSAVLACCFDRVYCIERNALSASTAKHKLKGLGFDNIDISVSDEPYAQQEKQPFDAIVVSARMVSLPQFLLQQLHSNGVLIASIGQHRAYQSLWLFRKSELGVSSTLLGSIQYISDIGEILIEQGLMSAQQIEQFSKEAVEKGIDLPTLLHYKTAISDTDLCKAQALQLGLEFGTYEDLFPSLNVDLIDHLSHGYLERYKLIPIEIKKGCLRVATCDPNTNIDEIGVALGVFSAELCMITETTFQRLWSATIIKRRASAHFQITDPEEYNPGQGNSSADTAVRNAISTGSVDSRAQQLLESILLDGIGERASDIHFEHVGNSVRIRIRVDGELRILEKQMLNPFDFSSIVNVIKVLAKLNITDRRRPQSGSFRWTLAQNEIELRVQTQLASHGENVILRLLKQQTKALGICQLGFPEIIANAYGQLLGNPGGLLLVTGPTGSGKTTTLYAALLELAGDIKRKVISVEDPIECLFDGIQQTTINKAIDFTFARAVRHFVRQDPDVIVVGEIRDEETALEAIRASQTGHLVISTLHSNDSTDAIQRLLDLGVHPNSISSELLAIISQRLVKRICNGCKQATEPDEKMLFKLGVSVADFPVVYDGAGCKRCGGHGTFGRIAVPEFMQAGPELRTAISMQSSIDDLRAASHCTGLITMRESYLELVRSGEVSLNVARSVLSEERMRAEPTTTLKKVA